MLQVEIEIMATDTKIVLPEYSSITKSKTKIEVQTVNACSHMIATIAGKNTFSNRCDYVETTFQRS